MYLLTALYGIFLFKIFANYFANCDGDTYKNIKILITSTIILFVFLNLRFEVNFYIMTEIVALTAIAIEDELNYEVDFLFLIWLLIFFLLKYIFSKTVLNLKVIVFSNLLYLVIYFISKKSIGEGDLILNAILAGNFSSIFGYYINFVATFLFGMIYSLILLKNGENLKTKVAFIKFMVWGYIFTLYGGIYV